ncbi:uncharacterized protein LOC143283260 isoform X2 [Babylonia areolata]
MKPSLTTIIMLCCTCFLGCQCSCRPGPAACSFRSTCPWTFSSGWEVYYHFLVNYYLELKTRHNAIERFESRKVCSTKSDIHCLKFQYNFKTNNVLSLSVIIKTSELGEKEVWKMSSSRSSRPWDNAQVPVKTTTEFTVIFEARDTGNHIVYIDDIEYEEEECEISPPNAIPPLTTTSPATTQTSTTSTVVDTTTVTTTSPATTQTSTTSTVADTTTVTTTSLATPQTSKTSSIVDTTTVISTSLATPQTGTMSTVLDTTTTTSSSATATPVTTMLTTPITPSTSDHQRHTISSTGSSGSAPTTPSAAGRAAPAESSSNVGMIAGVVVAVVFLLVVGVVLVVLFKRKQTHAGKTSSGQVKRRHVQTSHNAAYTLDENDPEQFNSVVTNPVNPVNTDRKAQHSTAEYANWNDPKQPDHRRLPQDPKSSDENVYENEASREVMPPNSAPPQDDYNRLDFHTGRGDRREGFPSSSDHTGDYNHVTALQPQPEPATDRDDGGAGLYQAISTCHSTRPPQPPRTAHRPVTNRGAQKLHKGVHQHPELSTGHTPSDHETSPNLKETPELPAPPSQDTTNYINYTLQKRTSEERFPERSHNHGADKSGQYQHLDFDGKILAEERSDDMSAQVYSHLNAGGEGAYDAIGRKPNKGERDGDYSHI